MMESIAFYEGVLKGYEREIIALERFGNGRIGQWRELLRDYKESRRQVDTIRAETIDACIEVVASAMWVHWHQEVGNIIDEALLDAVKKALENLKGKK